MMLVLCLSGGVRRTYGQGGGVRLTPPPLASYVFGEWFQGRARAVHQHCIRLLARNSHKGALGR